MLEIKVKYHADIEKLKKISIGDWIDLRSAKTVLMKKGEFRYLDLGISVQVPEGYESLIAPRSSTCKKFGIIQTNSPAVIDNSYCGDDDVWKIPVIATRDTVIHKNDRICQFRIIKNQPELKFVEVEHMGNKNRGGFGSTGVK